MTRSWPTTHGTARPAGAARETSRRRPRVDAAVLRRRAERQVRERAATLRQFDLSMADEPAFVFRP